MELETRAAFPAELEIRQRGGARILSGRFPYNRVGTIADRGRVRKERFGPRAFGWQLRAFNQLQEELQQIIQEEIATAQSRALREAIQEQLERRNTHVLVGHDFNRPLGDRLRGTARFTDSDDALSFEVDLPDPADTPAYFEEALAMIRSNRTGGLSPGFRVPPPSAVRNAQILTPEPGNPAVMIRDVRQAVLYELSLVSRPVYAGTELALRAEDFAQALQRRARVWL